MMVFGIAVVMPTIRIMNRRLHVTGTGLGFTDYWTSVE